MRFILLACFLVTCFFTHAQFNFYFGNIHAHSSFSDGCKDSALVPRQCYEFAKQSANFDFLGISEHNHNVNGVGMQLESYEKGLAQADEENEDGEFVCMYGIEFGLNQFGHVLIYGLSELPGWETGNFDVFNGSNDYNGLWKLVNDHNAFATLAHPDYDHFNELARTAYKSRADKAVCGTAIRNGPHDSESLNYDERPATSYSGYYKTLLSLGYRVGPTIDHDNHNVTFGRTTSSRTVILARELKRDSIIAAYKAMRFYASEDWNIRVTLTVKGRPMGSQLSSKYPPVIRVTVEDPDVSDEVDYIKIMYGRAGSGIKAKALASAVDVNSINTTHHGVPAGHIYYYYAEIRQKDGDIVITSPIWVKKNP